MDTPVAQGTSLPVSRFRNARASALRGAKVGAVVGGGIFMAAIALTTATVLWQRWAAGTSLFPFSLKTWGLLIGNFVGGTLVSAAWGGLFGAFIMGIAGACRKTSQRT
jgi:hypothetical protein